MRIFIALPLPEKIRAGLAGLAASLKADYRGSWVKKENYHITLVFIGETDQAGLELITARLREAVKGQKKFKMTAGSLSAFPSKKNVKVLYSYPEHGDKMCRDLYEKIAGALPASYTAGGKFNTHITLARFYKKRPLLSAEAWQQKTSLSFTVDRCVVYKSVTSQYGAEYSVLDEIFFSGDPE